MRIDAMLSSHDDVEKLSFAQILFRYWNEYPQFTNKELAFIKQLQSSSLPTEESIRDSKEFDDSSVGNFIQKINILKTKNLAITDPRIQSQQRIAKMTNPAEIKPQLSRITNDWSRVNLPEMQEAKKRVVNIFLPKYKSILEQQEKDYPASGFTQTLMLSAERGPIAKFKENTRLKKSMMELVYAMVSQCFKDYCDENGDINTIIKDMFKLRQLQTDDNILLISLISDYIVNWSTLTTEAHKISPTYAQAIASGVESYVRSQEGESKNFIENHFELFQRLSRLEKTLESIQKSKGDKDPSYRAAKLVYDHAKETALTLLCQSPDDRVKEQELINLFRSLDVSDINSVKTYIKNKLPPSSFEDVFDRRDEYGAPRPLVHSIFFLPKEYPTASGWRNGFAIVGAVLASPISLFVKWPIKLIVEWPLHAIEKALCKPTNNLVVRAVGELAGALSSFVRYAISFNPIQSAQEAGAKGARPSRMFGDVAGKWIGRAIGFVTSLGGIGAFAFLAPTAVVGIAGAIGGPSVATAVTGALNTATTTLHLGVVGEKLGVAASAISTAASTSIGVPLSLEAAGLALTVLPTAAAMLSNSISTGAVVTASEKSSGGKQEVVDASSAQAEQKTVPSDVKITRSLIRYDKNKTPETVVTELSKLLDNNELVTELPKLLNNTYNPLKIRECFLKFNEIIKNTENQKLLRDIIANKDLDPIVLKEIIEKSFTALAKCEPVRVFWREPSLTSICGFMYRTLAEKVGYRAELVDGKCVLPPEPEELKVIHTILRANVEASRVKQDEKTSLSEMSVDYMIKFLLTTPSIGDNANVVKEKVAMQKALSSEGREIRGISSEYIAPSGRSDDETKPSVSSGGRR